MNIFSRIHNLTCNIYLMYYMFHKMGMGQRRCWGVWSFADSRAQSPIQTPAPPLTQVAVESQASPPPLRGICPIWSELYIRELIIHNNPTKQLWMSERAEKSSHWIKTWWLACSSTEPGNYYLINRAFSCLFCRWQPVIKLFHSQR